MQLIEEICEVEYTQNRVGRIVDGMTVVDAIIQDINHLTIDEAEKLYNNTMKGYENYGRQNRR